jgi:hypothetical protein
VRREEDKEKGKQSGFQKAEVFGVKCFSAVSVMFDERSH